MKFIHVVAADTNNAIGIGDKIPWHLPIDLQWFKYVTTGKVCIVGRKTYDSLPEKVKRDPNRKFVVVSRSKLHLKHALKLVSRMQEDSILIIGGSEIYSQTSNIVDEVWITRVHQSHPEADKFYPGIPKGFRILDSDVNEESNGLTSTVERWVKTFNFNTTKN